MQSNRELALRMQEDEAQYLQHHIAQMSNPDNFVTDLRVKRYNELVAEKKELEAKQVTTWDSFSACKEPVKSRELLHQYETGVARLTQLDFLINAAYNRL